MEETQSKDPYHTHFLRLAKYHHWAYSKLFKQLEGVADTDYRKDLGLFFKSIHGTLNHLLLVDRLWYGRFVGSPIQISGLDQELVQDRAELYDKLLEQAALWCNCIAALEPKKLLEDFAYTDTKGLPYTRERGPILDHVFNHGTHHRGQVSAAITQLGCTFQQLDLLYFIPEFEKYSLEK